MAKSSVRLAMVLLSVSVSVSVSVAACGSPGQEPTAVGVAAPATRHGFVTPSIEAPLPKAENFAETGLSLDVPLDNVKPSVSYDEAFSTCFEGDAICEPDKSPGIYLARATVTSMGTVNKEGELVSPVRDKLAYVIKYDGVTCPLPAGPVGLMSPKARLCTELSLVDAETGKVLFSVSQSR